jgi:hypothetical protein
MSGEYPVKPLCTRLRIRRLVMWRKESGMVPDREL